MTADGRNRELAESPAFRKLVAGRAPRLSLCLPIGLVLFALGSGLTAASTGVIAWLGAGGALAGALTVLA